MHRTIVAFAVYCIHAAHCHTGTLDPLCNSTINLANASGIAEYQPDFAQAPPLAWSSNTSSRTLPAYVATTVTSEQEFSSLWVTTWINTNGANYSDDANLGYDVCGMALTHIPDNTALRAQNDQGDCTGMLDQACVDGITSAAEKYALRLVLNPPSWADTNTSNISWVSAICPDLANMLNSSPPKECSPYFWPNTTWYGATALTESNSSSLYRGCQSSPEPGSKLRSPWWSINSGDIHYSDQAYDTVVNHVNPVLGIWMTVANGRTIGPTVPTNSRALLKCIKPGQKIMEGSRIPAAMPAPTPVSPWSTTTTISAVSKGSQHVTGPKELSDACKAGVVVAAVAGIALIIGAMTWWLRRRAKQKQLKGEQKELESEPHNDSAVESKNVMEMPQPDRIHELQSERKTAELQSEWSTVELEGSIPIVSPLPVPSPSASQPRTPLSPVSPEEKRE